MLQKNKYKYVLQKFGYDCGVAASATLLLNAGFRKINYEHLGKELNVSKMGVLSDDISEYFLKLRQLEPKIKINSTVRALKNELEKGKLCMVMYQGWAEPDEIHDLKWGHYAVVVGIFENKIYILDPSVYEDWGDGIGWRAMNVEEFKERWVETEKGQIIKGWMLSVKPKRKIIKED